MKLEEFFRETENIELIDHLCRKKINSELEAIECFNFILDKLKEDSGRRITAFKGKSSLKTYITVVVSSLIIDFRRKKYGRSRVPKLIAEKGKVGVEIFNQLIIKETNEEEAYKSIKARGIYGGSFAEFLDLVNELNIYRYQKNPKIAFINQEDFVSLNSPSNCSNPLEQLLDGLEKKEKERKISIIKKFVEQLSPQNKLIIKMSFRDGLSNIKIAKGLGIKPKEISTIKKKIISDLKSKFYKDK